MQGEDGTSLRIRTANSFDQKHNVFMRLDVRKIPPKEHACLLTKSAGPCDPEGYGQD